MSGFESGRGREKARIEQKTLEERERAAAETKSAGIAYRELKPKLERFGYSVWMKDRHVFVSKSFTENSYNADIVISPNYRNPTEYDVAVRSNAQWSVDYSDCRGLDINKLLHLMGRYCGATEQIVREIREAEARRRKNETIKGMLSFTESIGRFAWRVGLAIGYTAYCIILMDYMIKNELAPTLDSPLALFLIPALPGLVLLYIFDYLISIILGVSVIDALLPLPL